MLERNAVYEALRELLDVYSIALKSTAIEIFAIEMERPDELVTSYDPALLDEFERLYPPLVSPEEARELAAQYVNAELVVLRRIDGAKQIVDDLRLGCSALEGPNELLQRW